jgi:antitoxin (DNA-binding transcriptional repressor) of toxin-antitoxin stability system
MSAMISIEEAQAHLAELIAKLVPGEELVITKGDRPVAKLVGQLSAEQDKELAGFPVIDAGPWPEGLSLRREDIYGDDGR